MPPKWLVIAINEYRIRTSFIRVIRPYFLLLVILVLAGYVLVIAPRIVTLFIDEFAAFIVSQAAVAAVEVILFLIFCYFAVLPITSALREETRQLETLLSAPVYASDVLLGTFLGVVPLYAIMITVITGLFTAVLTPLGLNSIQLVMIILIFVVIFLSAFWIGTVCAALLKTTLGKTARGKDIGRALAMILALPLVALFYAIAYGGLVETLTDPGKSGIVKMVLGWLPSSWGADIIVTYAVNPGSVTGAGITPVVKFCSLLIFFVVILWLGSTMAHRFYRLERITFIGARANPDSIFYKIINRLGGGGSFGTLVVSLFKDYSRRLENISNITYMLGILGLMIIFVAPQSSGPDDPPAALITMLFIFPLIVVMVTGEVTVRGKESLYLYRKAPPGESLFIKAMVVKSWIMAVPLAGVVIGIISGLTLQYAVLITTGLVVLFVAGYTLFVLGIFLLNPPFTEKSIKLWINVMIAMFGSIGLFMGSLLVTTKGGALSEPVGGLPSVLLVQAVLAWIIGGLVLYFGKMKLKKIE